MPLPAVTVRREPLVLPTYEPLPPDRHPMFLDRRVYQGSSGRVYPLPLYSRISSDKSDRAWDAVHLENEFLRVTLLPELGGRIHSAEDKTNGYSFFYRQRVIKPALVGLAGPWISGGVEFNWPQHHRPATFMPVDVAVEEHADGSRTVWMSDHDPMQRMKGMHGVCLHPDRAVIELKVRAYNRTPYVQTFLWWANVAVHVHEGYQSFFPPDVTSVADHARRAMSRFPCCDGSYYGVNYGRRARHGVPAAEVPARFVPPHCRSEGRIPGVPVYAPNDLTWYANIPVPTSYMALGSVQDFSGGYDHHRKAGLVQIADHHIAPGKKQWTWGNHEFGYAWDRNLTDEDGPYVELMLGVYTDNQPDFSFLQPGETKSWSVFWYPYRDIGPVQAANVEAAIAVTPHERHLRLGVTVTRRQPGAVVEVFRRGRRVARWRVELAPERPLLRDVRFTGGADAAAFEVRVTDREGRVVISHTHVPPKRGALPAPASEPPLPAKVGSSDELYLIGLHLEQYRHATRDPRDYWLEALRRDPDDSRCNLALGRWHFRRGEFIAAERRFRRAQARLTSRNPNPADGEPAYQLGLALRALGRNDEAYAAFAKAAWNQAWQPAAEHAMAEIACAAGEWGKALDCLDRSLRCNAENLRARDLRAIVLRRLGREREAATLLDATLTLDPLDWWARTLRGESLTCDTQTRIDVALDFARAGLHAEAVAILRAAAVRPDAGTAPMLHYHLAAELDAIGHGGEARLAARRAERAAPDYCFPARLEDLAVLRQALDRNPHGARAAYYLGNLLYDRRRHEEAIELWERSVRLAADNAVAWRNLGLAYFNVRHSGAKARRAYDRAVRLAPTDARVFHERDQLWKRLGAPAARRLREFERRREVVAQRDDTTLEFCALLNQTGQPQRADALLRSRRFQPWEGGEGQALGQWVRTQLALARRAIARGDTASAIAACREALTPPEHLGEARHPLANASDVLFQLGEALAAAGDRKAAREAWGKAAAARGDFREMRSQVFSDLTYFSGRALQRLGRPAAARQLFRQLGAHARRLARTPAVIDYFATSLPTLLWFDDDLNARQRTTAAFLLAQSEAGLGRTVSARRLLRRVLRSDPGHAAAADLAAELG